MADPRIASLKSEIEALKDKIRNLNRARENDIKWEEWGAPHTSAQAFNFNVRRQLRGHFGKIYALDWAGDNTTLLSASQDGKLFVWNSFTETKKDVISLKSAWVMACAYDKTTAEGRFVACGGLDNICTIFDLKHAIPSAPVHELTGHDGYLSSCKFYPGGRMLTSSGDSKAKLWDVEQGKTITDFKDHSADVMDIAVNPRDANMFATGSCDSSVRVWDVRLGASVRNFVGHISDVNAVEWHPCGTAVGSGSDDASCRIFDLRSCGPVQVFTEDTIHQGVTDVCFSRSGRLMFAAYDDVFAIAWEAIDKDGTFHQLSAHKQRVSCIGVNTSGQALCTGSWDTELAVWA